MKINNMSEIKNVYESSLIAIATQEFLKWHSDLNHGIVDPNSLKVFNWGWEDGELCLFFGGLSSILMITNGTS